MTIYAVQHQDVGTDEFVTCVREDLYDGTNDEVLERSAEFKSREDAERFVTDICGLIHCGGDPAEFRIIEKI